MKIFVWALALVACVMVVKFTAIGPTIFTISAEHGWGVHVGDVLVLIPLGFATWFSFRKHRI